VRLEAVETRGATVTGRCRRTHRRSHPRRVRSVGWPGRVASCGTIRGLVGLRWRPCRRTQTSSRIRAYRTATRTHGFWRLGPVCCAQQDAQQHPRCTLSKDRRPDGVCEHNGRSGCRPVATQCWRLFHAFRFGRDPVSRMTNTLSQSKRAALSGADSGLTVGGREGSRLDGDAPIVTARNTRITL